MNKAWALKQKGFTIVELLIVIVVIGILAAITIVAYNGIQSRANLASSQAAIANINKKVELFKIDNDVYPTSITDCPTPAATNLCLTAGDSMTYRYAANNTASTPTYEVAAMGNSQFIYSSSAEKTSTASTNREFLPYTDLAPYIDKYGLVKYQIDFDIKSADVSVNSIVNLYMQNGSGSKYSFSKNIPVTTSYVHQSVVLTPTVSTGTLTQSMLAFYGSYGTGNIPTVKNVRIQLAS